MMPAAAIAAGRTWSPPPIVSQTLWARIAGSVGSKKQKRVDAALARPRTTSIAAALAVSGDFGKAVSRYRSSWNTQDAIQLAAQSQSYKELNKALDLIEQSLDPKYWTDEPLFVHLEPATGSKAFNLMQSAARELAGVLVDVQKGRVIAAAGVSAEAELTALLATARRVSQTLYDENQDLVAVKASNQKQVNAELAKAKEDLDKAAAL